MPSKKELQEDLDGLRASQQTLAIRVYTLETAFQGVKDMLELAKADRELPDILPKSCGCLDGCGCRDDTEFLKWVRDRLTLGYGDKAGDLHIQRLTRLAASLENA